MAASVPPDAAGRGRAGQVSSRGHGRAIPDRQQNPEQDCAKARDRFLDAHIIAAAAVHRHPNENGESKRDCPCEIRNLVFFLLNMYVAYILYLIYVDRRQANSKETAAAGQMALG